MTSTNHHTERFPDFKSSALMDSLFSSPSAIHFLKQHVRHIRNHGASEEDLDYIWSVDEHLMLPAVVELIDRLNIPDTQETIVSRPKEPPALILPLPSDSNRMLSAKISSDLLKKPVLQRRLRRRESLSHSRRD